MHDCRLAGHELQALGQAGLTQHVPADARGRQSIQNQTHVLQRQREGKLSSQGYKYPRILHAAYQTLYSHPRDREVKVDGRFSLTK